ncbi:MAG: acylphosphatase [Nitrospiraceae bacterium]|nr:acylphosphatase [Nitrospiraceae bacterium]
MAAYRYLIHGRVQGVGYRYFVLREAGALGVSGHGGQRAPNRIRKGGDCRRRRGGVGCEGA